MHMTHMLSKARSDSVVNGVSILTDEENRQVYQIHQQAAAAAAVHQTLW
jgi:hypothetical protein